MRTVEADGKVFYSFSPNIWPPIKMLSSNWGFLNIKVQLFSLLLNFIELLLGHLPEEVRWNPQADSSIVTGRHNWFRSRTLRPLWSGNIAIVLHLDSSSSFLLWHREEARLFDQWQQTTERWSPTSTYPGSVGVSSTKEISATAVNNGTQRVDWPNVKCIHLLNGWIFLFVFNVQLFREVGWVIRAKFSIAYRCYVLE